MEYIYNELKLGNIVDTHKYLNEFIEHEFEMNMDDVNEIGHLLSMFLKIYGDFIFLLLM
jgi:hypothetical protein